MLSFMLLDGNDVKRRSAQAYVWAALALIQGQQAQEIRDAAAMRIDGKPAFVCVIAVRVVWR